MKVDYKKDFKKLYIPSKKPSVVMIPEMSFFTIKGHGDPNTELFSKKVETLYAISYAVKMSYKSKEIPEGYYEYTVFPLEGEWDLVDTSVSNENKDNYQYVLMIRQPDFLTDQLFERFLSEAQRKKPDLFFNDIAFEKIEEGLCCQMLHLGSYDSEPESFEKMDAFCKESGYKRISMLHKEIYLNDPRKTSPEKLKTVLRYRVREMK